MFDDYCMRDHKVTHSHTHEHKHSHGMTGSIAVDPVRAVQAFEKALAAIDDLKIVYSAEIAKSQEDLDRSVQQEKKWNTERWEDYRKERDRIDEIRKKRDELRAKEKKQFFGLNAEDAAELKALSKDAHRLVFPPYPMMPMRIESDGDRINDLRSRVETQLAQCAVALDCAHLDPSWAANIYRIEQGPIEWVKSQYPFFTYEKDKK